MQNFADEGLTTAQISERLNLTLGQVKYQLLKTGVRLGRNKLPLNAPKHVERECKRHGLTRFYLAQYTPSQRGYVCLTCSTERNLVRRRSNKVTLVLEAGGACSRCGYANCIDALQFHHLDREKKVFGIMSKASRSVENLRIEAAKCELLCANCHYEVEAGLRNPQACNTCGEQGTISYGTEHESGCSTVWYCDKHDVWKRNLAL